jgi:hypothetical protein
VQDCCTGSPRCTLVQAAVAAVLVRYSSVADLHNPAVSVACQHTARRAVGESRERQARLAEVLERPAGLERTEDMVNGSVARAYEELVHLELTLAVASL